MNVMDIRIENILWIRTYDTPHSKTYEIFYETEEDRKNKTFSTVFLTRDKKTKDVIGL